MQENFQMQEHAIAAFFLGGGGGAPSRACKFPELQPPSPHPNLKLQPHRESQGCPLTKWVGASP